MKKNMECNKMEYEFSECKFSPRVISFPLTDLTYLKPEYSIHKCVNKEILRTLSKSPEWFIDKYFNSKYFIIDLPTHTNAGIISKIISNGWSVKLFDVMIKNCSGNAMSVIVDKYNVVRVDGKSYSYIESSVNLRKLSGYGFKKHIGDSWIKEYHCETSLDLLTTSETCHVLI